MRRIRQPVKSLEITVGGETLRGTPAKLIEKLDQKAEEATGRGDHVEAQEMWQRSEYLKKEFDRIRNS